MNMSLLRSSIAFQDWLSTKMPLLTELPATAQVPEHPTVTGCHFREIWKNCVTRNVQTYRQLFPTRPRLGRRDARFHQRLRCRFGRRLGEKRNAFACHVAPLGGGERRGRLQ